MSGHKKPRAARLWRKAPLMVKAETAKSNLVIAISPAMIRNSLPFGGLFLFTLYSEVSIVSYVNPILTQQFESLSADLQKEILSRDVKINTLHDFIAVLEDIVAESE